MATRSTATIGIKRIDWIRLLTLSFLWGGSFFFVGAIDEALPPLTITFFRVGIAAIIILMTLRIMKISIPFGGRIWRRYAVMGLINNAIPFFLLTWGMTQIETGMAAILNATTPLYTIIIGHFWIQQEPMTRWRFLAVLVGLGGVCVLVGADSILQTDGNAWGEIACLAAGLSYAFAGVYGTKLKTLGVDPLAATGGMLCASSLWLVPLVLLIDQPWNLSMPSFYSVTALFGLAAFSTSFAYLLYFRLLASAGATSMSLVTFLIPPTSILLGISFLGESFEAKHAIGMALIGGSLILIDGRLFARRKKA